MESLEEYIKFMYYSITYYYQFSVCMVQRFVCVACVLGCEL